jgi:hypothetical protein
MDDDPPSRACRALQPYYSCIASAHLRRPYVAVHGGLHVVGWTLYLDYRVLASNYVYVYNKGASEL